jgi:uncharacterized protein with HEPN domain
MQRDPKAYLWDAREAITTFAHGRPIEDFQQDLMLRSAVERQFEIVGEALGQLARLDAALARQIPNLPQIIAFRNILIHGYAVVDSDRVWRVVHENLPELREVIERLLADIPPDGEL